MEFRDRDLDRKAMAKEIQRWGRKKLGDSSLKRTESLNLINLQNALKGFEEDGTLLPAKERRVIDEAGWKEYRGDFRRLLNCGND